MSYFSVSQKGRSNSPQTSPRGRPLLPSMLLFALCFSCSAAWSSDSLSEEREAYLTLDALKAEAGSIPRQAEVLAQAAWGQPDQTVAVRALARSQVIGYGAHSMPAIRTYIRAGGPLSSDATVALIHAAQNASGTQPPEFLAGVTDALWFGDIEARRVALVELRRHKFPPAVLPAIDTAYEFPALRADVMQTLAELRDDNARHFLAEVMATGSDREVELAAISLALIGGKSLQDLRRLATSERAITRRSAANALLPSADVEDISLLAAFLDAEGESDHIVATRVAERINQLEDRVRRELEEELKEDDAEKELPGLGASGNN